jgi:hypothetical protein
MFAAIAMQIIGQVANVAGTEGSVAGQRAAGKYNRNLLYQKAKMEEQAANRETEMAVKQGRRLKASQYAAYSKSGAVPTSGTPLLTMVEQSGDMQRDILENRRNRLLQSEGLRHQGDYGYQEAKMQGYATRLAGISQAMNKGSSMSMPSGGKGGGAKVVSSVAQKPQARTLLTMNTRNQNYNNAGSNDYA